MNNLYKQAILELYQDQTNRGDVENPHFSMSLTNPLCGDTVSMTGLYLNSVIEVIRFRGNGCVLSQAAAAFITKYAKGKDIKQLRLVNEEFMQEQLGLRLGPTRLRCIMLPVECLFQGLTIVQRRNTP